MIIDYEGNLSDAQDETTVADHISDNVVNLQVAGRRIIAPWWYVFRIDTAIVSAAGTLKIQMVTSAAEALSSPTVLWDSGVLSNATIVAWAINTVPYVIPVYYNGALLQYFGAIYVIASGVFTAGKWDMLRAVNVPNPIL